MYQKKKREGPDREQGDQYAAICAGHTTLGDWHMGGARHFLCLMENKTRGKGSPRLRESQASTQLVEDGVGGSRARLSCIKCLTRELGIPSHWGNKTSCDWPRMASHGSAYESGDGGLIGRERLQAPTQAHPVRILSGCSCSGLVKEVSVTGVRGLRLFAGEPMMQSRETRLSLS